MASDMGTQRMPPFGFCACCGEFHFSLYEGRVTDEMLQRRPVINGFFATKRSTLIT